MLCKKCGAEIADTSKFCGYCGEIVETSEINQTLNVENNVVENTMIEDNLGETIKIDPVVVEELNDSESVVEPTVELVEEPVLPTGTELSGSIEPAVASVQSEIQNQMSVNDPVLPNNEGNKKSNRLIFIIIGVVLALVAAGLVVFAMNNNGNSISVLKKAMANLSEQGKDSATATVRLNVDAEGQALSFSATAKVEKKSEEELDMQLMVDKSLFTEEMSIYAKVTQEDVNVYMESTIIDLLGMTSSIDPSWVYYTLELEEIMDQIKTEETNDLKLEDVLDEKHFIFVEKIEDIRRYQLIIDQELLDTIEAKSRELANEDVVDSLSDMEQLEQPIKIDFYITQSNEIVKIKLDMSEYFTEEDIISGLSISIEFKDLNSTKVEIPKDALNSTIDIETYITDNQVELDYNYEGNVDFDYNYDYNSSSDYNFEF